METAIIASLISSSVSMMGTLALWMKLSYSRGLNEGKLTAILENLERISADHETRLRVVEHHK